MKWRKASRSSHNAENCVESARVPGSHEIAMRDSKQINGPQLRFVVGEFAGFLEEIKQGKYDMEERTS